MKHFQDIENLSRYYGVDAKHPLLDVKRYEDVKGKLIKNEPIRFDFYTISFVKNFNGHIQIGNTKFEGDNGVLHFIAPGQVYTCNSTNAWEGFHVLIHPNIFKEHFAHKEINSYDFFSYEVNESLLLTEEEKGLVENLLQLSWTEFNSNNDSFSVSIILSYLSTLLNLAERFYARQFDSRKVVHNQLTKDFNALLRNYYAANGNDEIQQPTVNYFAQRLNVTANYLSDTVKHHSGKPALSIIQDFVIDQAKIKLANSSSSVSEIAYDLGFEYPNYFARLFKRKSGMSPSKFRSSVKSI